ncbi:hypothetical protein HUG17_1803 [Dermatophagoides farinae]|uniref:Translation initiation factor 3 N-terminal domain-containing protein n=1 Tax=Dermatophagoides farinae TaxID=6954 RepID=A0A9D4PAJ2_DERFA|nr:hypothetical protein HUG17_1803 [Dermatophagoides farinae]
MFNFINPRFFYSQIHWKNSKILLQTFATTNTNKTFYLPFVKSYSILNSIDSSQLLISVNSISSRYLSQSQKNSPHNNEIDVSDIAALESNDNGVKKAKYRGKTPELLKVYLRDEKNRLLGLMTMIEAEKLAQKHKKVLIQIEGPAKKIMTMKFSDPRFDQKDDHINDDGDDDDHTDDDSIVKFKKKTSPKIMSFTSKVSEHDLQVKINHVKKFLLRGQETLVKIASTVSNGSDKSKLENIFHEFESIFKESNGCRINQKRLTDRDLKFNILISDVEKAKQNLSFTNKMDNIKSIPNLDDIDPHKLLEEDSSKSILNEIENHQNK